MAFCPTMSAIVRYSLSVRNDRKTGLRAYRNCLPSRFTMMIFISARWDKDLAGRVEQQPAVHGSRGHDKEIDIVVNNDGNFHPVGWF